MIMCRENNHDQVFVDDMGFLSHIMLADAFLTITFKKSSGIIECTLMNFKIRVQMIIYPSNFVKATAGQSSYAAFTAEVKKKYNIIFKITCISAEVENSQWKKTFNLDKKIPVEGGVIAPRNNLQ